MLNVICYSIYCGRYCLSIAFFVFFSSSVCERVRVPNVIYYRRIHMYLHYFCGTVYLSIRIPKTVCNWMESARP